MPKIKTLDVLLEDRRIGVLQASAEALNRVSAFASAGGEQHADKVRMLDRIQSGIATQSANVLRWFTRSGAVPTP